jgi:hypothetical protein
MSDSLSVSQLREKLQQLDQIIGNAEKEKEHILYVLNEFTDLNIEQIPLTNRRDQYKPNISAMNSNKDIILHILKENRDRNLTRGQIYSYLKLIKPEISENTFNVTLSQLTNVYNSPIFKVGVGIYRYKNKEE